jgi:putative membrane protein
MNKNVKTAVIIGSIVIIFFIAVPLIFGSIFGWQNGGYGMMGGMMGGFGGGMWLMPIVWILIIGLILWVVVAQAGGSNGSEDRNSWESDLSLQRLKTRYAKGDITKEEYDEKKRGLTGEHGNWILDILKARYAKGDIGKEEYEEKKKDLL